MRKIIVWVFFFCFLHKTTFASFCSMSARAVVFPDKERMISPLANFIVERQKIAISTSGRFTIALSGGSLPQMLTGLISIPDVEWDKWFVFFVDERCVPLDHADSNFKACDQYLFQQVPIPRSQIFVINPSLPPEMIARDYQMQMEFFFGNIPEFDLIALGMGPDGHTASLFPGHPLCSISDERIWISHITDSPKMPLERITFTYPIINRAKKVVFVVTGDAKAQVLSQMFVVGEESNQLETIHQSYPIMFPAAAVSSQEGVEWFFDIGAVSLLSENIRSLMRFESF